jgi:hypothetical protein
MFRADSARYAGDRAFAELVDRLLALSPEFRDWWPRHEVLPPLGGHKRIRHPIAGDMTFEFTSFVLADGADQRLVVYTPLEADNSRERLRHLLDGSARSP